MGRQKGLQITAGHLLKLCTDIQIHAEISNYRVQEPAEMILYFVPNKSN